MPDIENNFYHNRLSKYMCEATRMKSKLNKYATVCYFHEGECEIYDRLVGLYDFYTTTKLHNTPIDRNVEKEFKQVFRLFKKLYKYEGVERIYE